VNKVPVSTVLPKIVGDPTTGLVLGSVAGGWDGYLLSYERRWLRCEADGLGCNPTAPIATGPTYRLTAADVGKRLQLEVTAVAADPNQARRAVALSAATGVIADPSAAPPPTPGGAAPAGPAGSGAAPSPPPLAAPTILIKRPKSLRRASKLTVPAKLAGYRKLTFAWLRGGKPIRRATKSTYRLATADAGKRIACRIKLTRISDGRALTVTTKAVPVPRRLRR
jgi:hypothetical protein